MYKTTDIQMMHVYKIATEMDKKGLPSSFIVETVNLASQYEGVYDLMVLWVASEEKEVLEDIQKLIDEKAKVLEDIKSRLIEMKGKS